MILSIPITIDLQDAYPRTINLSQNEMAGRRLAFTIVSKGIPVDLTGKTVLLFGKKPDGTGITLQLTLTAPALGQGYCDITSQVVSVAGNVDLQIRIFTPAATGSATSGTSTSMYDTSKTWTANAYAGKWLYISAGTGAGQARLIASNTATQLVVSSAWDVNPAAGSAYSIISEVGNSFVFVGDVKPSVDIDSTIVSSNEFSALTAVLATVQTYLNRIAALETAVAQFRETPIGAVMIWTTATAPEKHLICDGSAVSRTTYASLFAVLGTIYGIGDGSTTFNLPNLKGRVPVGCDSSQTDFDALGETGGEKTHALTISEMPNHNHGISANRNIYYSPTGTSGLANSPVLGAGIDAGAATPQGGNAAHNNLQPYMVVNYIIRAVV